MSIYEDRLKEELERIGREKEAFAATVRNEQIQIQYDIEQLLKKPVLSEADKKKIRDKQAYITRRMTYL